MKRNKLQAFFTVFLYIILLLAALAVMLLVFLTVTEYVPSPVEELKVDACGECGAVSAGDDLTLLTWNLGFGALGKESDFILDGGGKARPADEATVKNYMEGIRSVLSSHPEAALRLFQEVDIDSVRSHGIDERNYLQSLQNAFSLNYSCRFVPLPIPVMGKVNSGLYTAASARMESAERLSLFCPFQWPVSTANLKRCLLVSYLPVEGSDKKLVLINLHMDAYDEDAEGRTRQMEELTALMAEEFAKGNYVIAGGDFNQAMPGMLAVYPNQHEDVYHMPELEAASLPEGFTYVYDDTTPTCRLLNQPYDPSDLKNTQYYIIDGFIVSPNIQVNHVETIDTGFAFSDHNPVELSVCLLPAN